MKLNNKYEYLDINVINYINGILRITTNENFDEKEFVSWLSLADVESKNNPSGYVRSCFKKELEKGTFQPKAEVRYIPKTQELINAIRDKGICVLADESVWLSVVWEYLLWKEIDLNTCIRINHEVLDKLDNSNSFNDYKEQLMNSPLLKPYQINWKLVEEKVKIKILGWNKYLDELEKLESEE